LFAPPAEHSRRSSFVTAHARRRYRAAGLTS
jgi:hypothetical protein